MNGVEMTTHQFMNIVKSQRHIYTNFNSQMCVSGNAASPYNTWEEWDKVRYDAFNVAGQYLKTRKRNTKKEAERLFVSTGATVSSHTFILLKQCVYIYSYNILFSTSPILLY